MTETIFFRFCAIHQSPKKKKRTGTVSRWDLILEDYRITETIAPISVVCSRVPFLVRKDDRRGKIGMGK